jgi:hypothetical protein
MSTCTHGKELRARCIECEADMTDVTKGDGMTLETMLHRVTWIKDVTCDKTQPVTEFDRDRIHRFASELHAHLAAQSAMRVDELLDASEALVLALGKRGVHISFYDAKAAIQAAIGGRE